MQAENLVKQSAELIEHTHTGCKEAQHVNVAKSHHVCGYLCCTCAAFTASNVFIAVFGEAEALNSVSAILVLQNHPERKFKPPKL